MTGVSPAALSLNAASCFLRFDLAKQESRQENAVAGEWTSCPPLQLTNRETEARRGLAS